MQKGDNDANGKKTWLMLLFFIFWSVVTLAAAMKLTVGNFSGGDLGDWKTKSFQGMTRYRWMMQEATAWYGDIFFSSEQE
jgi:hypothetical protein